MGEERVFVPVQLAIIALMLAGFLILMMAYYTNPELTVGFMGQLLEAMATFKGKVTENLFMLGVEVVLQSSIGVSNLTGQG